jgi:hypothetical protein
VKAPLALTAAALLTLGLDACSFTPGGPEYAELGIRTLDPSGREAQRDCLPLPVLPGGVVEEDLALSPGLGAHVKNDQDSADVALSGTNDPASAHVTVPKEALLRGYSKTLAVTTTEGAMYSVVLLSPCVPTVDDGS